MTEGETTETPVTGAEPVDEEVLARFEEMFASRFTEEDETYQEYVTNIKEARVPPILNHYQVMRPRNQRYDIFNCFMSYKKIVSLFLIPSRSG